MRENLIRMTIISLISFLTACSSMSGNVVPQKGPSMEQVYDGMLDQREESFSGCRGKCYPANGSISTNVPIRRVSQEFRKIANPELRMYVFPHFALRDEIPIPGYFTVFNAYERDHYALTNKWRS
jgi:conjugative transfer region lipoprotein (TIGR03751 family)